MIICMHVRRMITLQNTLNRKFNNDKFLRFNGGEHELSWGFSCSIFSILVFTIIKVGSFNSMFLFTYKFLRRQFNALYKLTKNKYDKLSMFIITYNYVACNYTQKCNHQTIISHVNKTCNTFVGSFLYRL